VSTATGTRLSLVQLILVEIAAACVVCGLAAKHGWPVIGIAIGAVFILLGLVPARRRWLYQVLSSRVRLTTRRRGQRRFTGLASLAGPYRVLDVAPSGSTPIAVIQAGLTWALPLELRQDSVFNDDVAVPLDGFTSLLTIEDVNLASVRLLNIVTPAVVPASAPAGPTPLLPRGASRYCVLTLDTILAAGALADRGGSDAAIAQMLRRCAMRAEEVLGSPRLRVQPLDEAAAHRVLDNCLGQAAHVTDLAMAATDETGSGIRVGGTYSTTVALGGMATTALGTLAEIAPYLPGQAAASALVLTPNRHRGGAEANLLVRVSEPAEGKPGDLGARLRKVLGDAGLTVQRLDGEQGELLRATTLVGLSGGLA
jgi:type VII secretion protein EccE